MLNGLDLFSGIGGISLALKEYVRTIAYCEQDRYAQAVLLSRMVDGSIDRAPIWDDVTSLTSAMLPSIDIIYGGFPCQDISVAGRKAGLSGERSRLFHEVLRLADQCRPSLVFIENVGHGMERNAFEIAKAFYKIGYRYRDTYLSAFDIGANHRRERYFGLAHSNCQLLRIQPRWGGREEGKETAEYFWPSWWAREPAVSRVANGIPHRVDRLKCLGNSVVPAQAREAFKRLIGL